MIIPFLLLAISKPIKYIISPRSLILNVSFEVCLIHIIFSLSFPINIISSTYTNNVVKNPSGELMNKE